MKCIMDTFKFPNRISSDFAGYNQLINLFHELKSSPNARINFCFKNTLWFEANLSAVLGAIIELLEEQDKTIVFTCIPSQIESILCRNRFLTEFGYPEININLGTTIKYQRFSPDDGSLFMNYIKEELLSKKDFPKHSSILGKKINESIFEVYENARTHGKCKQTHTCGQYYPNKSPKRLDITIVDMGKTIKSNVNEYLSDTLSGSQAIEWALKYGHTTKTGNISGGLGLDIIFEFIKLNNGKIQVISSDGYWEYRNGNSETKEFENFFPGTIVNIEFNLDDPNRYLLKEEVSMDNIF